MSIKDRVKRLELIVAGNVQPGRIPWFMDGTEKELQEARAESDYIVNFRTVDCRKLQ